MKLTIGEAREFVRARLDELAAQASDMLLSAIDDRNLDNTIDTLLEDAITYIHLAAPASLMEGPILTESNFAQDDLTIVDRVLDIDTALADIGDDILRFISFQCGDSDIKLTSAFYEDSPQARMQLNKFIQGQPDSPVLVKLDDSPNYKPHFKYYTTDMCLDGMGQALRFVLRYFARPKLQGDTLSVSPSSLTLGAGINSKSFTVSSSSSWRVTSVLPDWISLGEMNGVAGTAFVSLSVLQNRGRAERSCSIVFANEESTATLEVTQRGYSNSEGDERLKVASTAMINGVIKLPSTSISDVLNIRVAAEAGLAWQAVLSDTENFFISPVSGIGTGIENYSTMIVGANSVNDTGAARTATITFTATGVRPIVVNLRQPTQLTVTPRLPSVGSAAGTQSFTITTESSWSIELLQPVPEGFELSAMSGNGNSALLCSYPKNDTGELRLMGFRVSGGGATVQVVISQSAAPQESISVSPSILGEYPASGDTAGMATSATVTASSAWEFDPNTLPAWATVQRRANTNEIHVVSVNENTSIEARSATIVVWLASDHSKTASLTITQAAKQSSITILDSDVPLDFISVPSTGGTFTATLVATGPWNISSNKSWLSITSPTSGVAGTTTITFAVASGSVADDAKIVGTLTDGSGKTCDYYVSREAPPVVQNYIKLGRVPDNWLVNDTEVPNTGGTDGASLRASGSWTAIVGPNSSWIHPVYQSSSPWHGSATQSTAIWFDVDANTGAARTGTIVATLDNATPGDPNATATFYINQAGDGTVTLSATFNRSTIEASGGDAYLNINTQNGVSWYIDQVSSGLSIDSSDYSGSGPATITVHVDSTSQASGRNLSLRVNNTSYNLHSTASLHQNGPSAPSTRLSIVPNGTKNIEWDKTSQEIRILAENVSWTVSCPDSDVHFSSSSGSNNATITATFSPNSSTANNRQMTITVTGGGYTCVLYLIQAKKTAERLTVSPTSVTIPATGGSETIHVTTVGTWKLSKSADWIQTSINAGTTSEATSFVISAQKNNEGARTGQVIVTGSGESKTITVSQGSGGTFSVDTDTVNLRQPANSSGAVTVYSAGAWVVYEGGSNIPDWLQYSYSTHVGSENGEVLTFTALTANTGSSPRTGSIVLALVGAPSSAPTITITVTQSAGSTLTLTPSTMEVSARGGDYDVEVTSNTDWSIVQISEGLAVDEDDASGTGDATVPIYVPGNPFSTSRPFSVTFRTADGAVTRTLTITQTAGELRASTTTVPEFSASGDSKTITLYSSAVWDVASKPSWISEIRPGSGYANTPDGQGITIVASENATGGTRSGQIIFRQSAYGNTLAVNVSQGAASAHTLEISPSEDVHLPNGDATTQQIVITSDTSWAVDLTGTFGCTVDIDHGTGNETITVTIPANTDASRIIVQHSVKIKTTDNSITRTLDIWQPLNTDVISVEPDGTITFTEDMPNAQLYIYSTRDWTAASNQSWLTITPVSGVANRQATMYLSAAISKRNIQRATITITSAGGVTKTISCRSLPSIDPVDPDDFNPSL